jgi:hypothetical protein
MTLIMWKYVFFNNVQGSKSIPPIKVKQQADYELEVVLSFKISPGSQALHRSAMNKHMAIDMI